MFTELTAGIKGCTNCGLAATRIQAVPGEGPPHAKIMFVGEAPGAQEDKQGRPFVGPAGKMLTTMLAAAGLTRQDVFITSVVKCRPPRNRNPKAGEIKACQPFLQQQIVLLKPQVICPLGNIALKTLLGPALTISQVHGKLIKRDGITYYPLFHPAACFYNPSLKADLLADMRKLGQYLTQQRMA